MPTLSDSLSPSKILYVYQKYHTDYLSMCTRFPAISIIAVLSGVANPNLREGEAVGVGGGTVRKSVCKFL